MGTYSNVPNKRACMFISGKVCLLGFIEVMRQTWLEINVHARLFGTLEYLLRLEGPHKQNFTYLPTKD